MIRCTGVCNVHSQEMESPPLLMVVQYMIERCGFAALVVVVMLITHPVLDVMGYKFEAFRGGAVTGFQSRSPAIHWCEINELC
jgi:hypothetical protein